VETYPGQAAAQMRVAAEAIGLAADRLVASGGTGFSKAVDLVAGIDGKVVVTGAGTSGIIARKIAATLTSTGTAAVFLHPADALHGALGVVLPADVAILISNSGETDELLALLPYLEERKVPMIAIVGNVDSTLAHHAEAVLDAFSAREACPLDLVPTATTSVALALGDALATTVMEVRDITPQAFAVNHPSGRLGKRLTLKVEDLMHSGARRPFVTPDATWLEVVTAVSDGGIGAVTVEVDGTLLGIVTDGDVRRAVQESGEHLTTMRAEDLMTPNPVTVSVGLLAYEALRLMEDRPSQISVLPVVDELERCVGLVRLHDLVRSGL
jgi:arabinose-5-phosphate isomerase